MQSKGLWGHVAIIFDRCFRLGVVCWYCSTNFMLRCRYLEMCSGGPTLQEKIDCVSSKAQAWKVVVPESLSPSPTHIMTHTHTDSKSTLDCWKLPAFLMTAASAAETLLLLVRLFDRNFLLLMQPFHPLLPRDSASSFSNHHPVK